MSVSVCWALFEAHPASKPPFTTYVGINDHGDYREIPFENCEHIPDAIDRIKKYCHEQGISFSSNFSLLYPIFMEAMNTEYEGSMHQIAWIVKDISDEEKWNFGRTGGLTGRTKKDFY